MGAEQSGDAEHKHAELNSSGERNIFYVFHFFYSITVEYQVSVVTCVCAFSISTYVYTCTKLCRFLLGLVFLVN